MVADHHATEMALFGNDEATVATSLSNKTNAVGVQCDVKEPLPPTACVLFSFVFNALLIGLVCLAGLVGNIVSLVVLQKDRCNRVAGFLLQFLAVADCFVLLVAFLVCAVFVGAVSYFLPGNDVARDSMPYLVKYLQPVGYMSQTMTIWTTVLLAINRYIGICRPFDAPIWCTMKRARLQVILVSIFSVGYNLPRFFQYDIFRDPCGAIRVRPSSMGEHSLFGTIYTNALFTLAVLLLPLMILLYLNSRVINELHTYKKRRDCLVNASFIRTRGEKSITLVMLVIIIVFLICHTPDRIFQIMKNFLPQQGCRSVYFYMKNVCNMLVILNSSTNFIIYFVFRKRFRKIFYMNFCAWAKMWRRAKQPELLGAQVQYTALTSVRASMCSQV